MSHYAPPREAQGGGPPSLEDASAQVRGLGQELSYLK